MLPLRGVCGGGDARVSLPALADSCRPVRTVTDGAPCSAAPAVPMGLAGAARPLGDRPCRLQGDPE